MCGIAGYWKIGGTDPVRLRAFADAACRILKPRGPDDQGQWVDENAGFVCAQTRLAILDLSPQGHQPMLSTDGRYALVYNGEIYNFRELRTELAKLGHSFRGHSDTEVLLAACMSWGVDRTVRRCEGMFAFALWDSEKRKLSLARDRLGIKPLCVVTGPHVVAFASTFAALAEAPGVELDVDPNALASYFFHGYVPGTTSIYGQGFKVEPGTWLEIDERGVRTEHRYWSAVNVAGHGQQTARSLAASRSELLDELSLRVESAVEQRMVADVELGGFLSGGIDSSLVVAMMQRLSRQPVRSFTIAFADPRFDESEHALGVARHLQTDHEILQVNESMARDLVPDLATAWDEPFADSSAIPTLLLSRLTRKFVTVALSGDGGDELFGGYQAYRVLDQIWGRLDRVPQPLRRAVAALITRLPASAIDRAFAPVKPILPARLHAGRPADRLTKLARVLGQNSALGVHAHAAQVWPRELGLVRGASWPGPFARGYQSRISDSVPNEVGQASLHDSLRYLPDDILTKVDRASMAASLEARVPLLDHRLFEFVWSIDFDTRSGPGRTKQLLRELLYRFVPKQLVERPKKGFSVPIANWLRGPLRGWAEDLMQPVFTGSHAHLVGEPLRRTWQEHLSRRHDHRTRLWSVLMYLEWERARARGRVGER